jgi:nitrate reductase NapAB chaperone NapD
MGICSYLVVPEPGQAEAVRRSLAGMSGCDVVSAERHDLLILVSDTPGPPEDEALRVRVEAMHGVQALVPTFAEVVAP